MKYKLYFLLFVFALVFFIYRINKVPQGITIDEAAFGYNAVLLSKTAKDENNRTLPVFILSINGQDWRNPIPQYSFAGFFKIFGASVKNLRIVSAIYASFSAVLLYYLIKTLYNNLTAVFSYLLFLTTPVIMIHAHLGLDILTPIPFILVWLIALNKYDKTRSINFLLISAFSLGLAFYSYKAARAMVPIFSLTTAVYLIKQYNFKSAFYFSILISPFYLIIPILEYKYAGAILGGNNLSLQIYPFFHSYLSTFDFSFLFIEGDQIIHHSTTKHGMLLLSTLPLILVGIYKTIADNKNSFSKFILLNLILGPILIGLTGSYHRASRLAILTPFFIYFAAIGLSALHSYKPKFIFKFFAILILFNAYSFLNYYLFNYAQDTYHHFYSTNSVQAYKKLLEFQRKYDASVYQTSDLVGNDDEKVINNFLRSIYFTNQLPSINNISGLPENSLLISHSSNLNIEELSNINNFYIYKK